MLRFTEYGLRLMEDVANREIGPKLSLDIKVKEIEIKTITKSLFGDVTVSGKAVVLNITMQDDLGIPVMPVMEIALEEGSCVHMDEVYVKIKCFNIGPGVGALPRTMRY